MCVFLGLKLQQLFFRQKMIELFEEPSTYEDEEEWDI